MHLFREDTSRHNSLLLSPTDTYLHLNGFWTVGVQVVYPECPPVSVFTSVTRFICICNSGAFRL